MIVCLSDMPAVGNLGNGLVQAESVMFAPRFVRATSMDTRRTMRHEKLDQWVLNLVTVQQSVTGERRLVGIEPAKG